jgi:N-acyl-D-aspartate/D-glutamate deacylase
MDFDLAIRGGTLVDGTGRAAVRGDLGIKDGRIAAVGEVKGSAARTLDADGRVVAPGFIDIHTHYDAQVLWDRMLTISPWHGVTTVVMGNCGFGVAPTRPEHRGLILRTLEKVEGMSLAALEAGIGAEWPFETFPEYLDAVERRGAAHQHGRAARPHAAAPLRDGRGRDRAAGHRRRDRAHARHRARGVDAGALGFATSKASTHVGYGGRPVPSRAAAFAEVQALAGALGDAGRGIVQATVGRDLFFSEFETLARDTGGR